MDITKCCSKCRQIKDITEFNLDNKTKDGYTFWCKQCARIKQQNYYYNNKEKVKKYQQEYGAQHREELSSYMKKYREENIIKLKLYDKHRIAELKKDVISHYGGECSCCGEKQIEFLSIDHINGDGAEERRRLFGDRTYGGWSIYRLIQKNGYPAERYQVLCMNCNFAKAHNNNICPHNK